MSFSDELKYDSNGLFPAIMQDVETKEVLMLAYMNKTSFDETVKTGKAHFWSRSRQKYWMKGESSGHIQTVKKMFFDCDLDAVVMLIEQVGGACHMGYKSCFYRELDTDKMELKTIGEKVFDEKDIYKK
jgi:phosphoribosyl-AMP cyclohydrolase